MTFKLFTSISIAAMTTLFSITALAQGGNDPISGIDIIMKRDPSSQPIKPFSMTPDEIAQLNKIKGVGRMELILKAAAKRVEVKDAHDRFAKSGMAVMGKDWCGECPWPETASYTFNNGKTTYKLELKFHAEAEGKYIGETEKNQTSTRPEKQQLLQSIPAGEPQVGTGQPQTRDGNLLPLIILGNKASQKANNPASTGCVTVDGAVDANCDGVDDAKPQQIDDKEPPVYFPAPRQQRR